MNIIIPERQTPTERVNGTAMHFRCCFVIDSRKLAGSGTPSVPVGVLFAGNLEMTQFRVNSDSAAASLRKADFADEFLKAGF